MSTKAAVIEQLIELLKNDEEDSLVLTIPEVAQLLGVAENTVYKLISSGDLRAVDLSTSGAKRSKTRVRRDDLDAFIEARTRQAAS